MLHSGDVLLTFQERSQAVCGMATAVEQTSRTCKSNAVIQTQQFETSNQSLSVQSVLTGHVANMDKIVGRANATTEGRLSSKKHDWIRRSSQRKWSRWRLKAQKGNSKWWLVLYEDDQAQKEIDECGVCYGWMHTGFCVGKTRYLFAGWSKRLHIDQFFEVQKKPLFVSPT